MLLRTLAGGRAGQIEDYQYQAGRNAIAAGFAERIADVGPGPEVKVQTPVKHLGSDEVRTKKPNRFGKRS